MKAESTTLVAAGILIEADRVLITQRKAGTHLEGVWEFPGGKVLPAEDPRAGLARELEEELGLDTEVGEVIDATFHLYEEVGKAILLLFFEVRRLPGSPTPRALDVAAFRWADPSDLEATSFPPADATVLRKVKARLRSAGH